MTGPLRTLGDYELFIYTLPEAFHPVRRSTLRVIRRGATLALVTGEVEFDQDIRPVVRERLVFDRLPGRIDGYGYEVWRGPKKLY